ncbi:rhodanese-like domain-containing protein [Cohnella endophytica]|uniref:Rhodanese-like domain-containing protein n=1 Tax=Cohnella endophytica TaxID=2419778 RepID=A0A494Y108_9BACL|nr:rhodanese-like domain-containing protein [Cohnella endophytica]RKP54032.1 rhodanese-like domain-containing protein [Cohnella endophytica]
MQTKGWTNVKPETVEQWIGREEVQMIDVRSVGEYMEGHIPGAKLIPLDQLDVRTFEIDKNREIVCVCRSGKRSASACEYLASLGFSKVMNMDGGMSAWSGAISTQ